MESVDARERARAARALGDVGGDGIADALLESAKKIKMHGGFLDEEVRETAEALGKIGDERAIPLLTEWTSTRAEILEIS